MQNQINLFIDKPDLIIKITDDDIINITGSVGFGKSTLSKIYKNKKEYIVIGLDSIYSDNDTDTLNENVLELRKILLKKYKNLEITKNMCYYQDIVDFIVSKNKKGIIEGGFLLNIEDISKLKGTVIVKRTARFKCFYRAVYRDFKNPTFRIGLTKLGLIKRFTHVFRRRFNILYRQKNIERFITNLKYYRK